MKILVAVDFSFMDKRLLNFLSNNHEKLGPIEKVYFLYIKKNADLPDEVKKLIERPDEDQRLLSLIDEELKDESSSHLRSLAELQVLDGPFEEQMINFVESHKVDLVLLGHKPRAMATGLRARRFACRTEANVLFVPEKRTNLRKILVPVDFSKQSDSALKTAFSLSNSMESPTIECLHVYEGLGETENAKAPRSEIDSKLKEYADQKMTDFLGQFDSEDYSNVRIVGKTLSDESKQLSTVIQERAANEGYDLIIMGSRGETFIAWILIGSTAEKMMLTIEDIPLMIIKSE